jgi:hypothetical protein
MSSLQHALNSCDILVGPGNPVGQCPVLGGHFPRRSGTGSWQTCPLKRTVPYVKRPQHYISQQSKFFHALQHIAVVGKSDEKSALIFFCDENKGLILI